MPVMTMPLTIMNMFVPQAARETMLRFPIMTATSPKIAEPSAGKPIEDLRDQLRLSLTETKRLFAGALPRHANRVTVSHPVLGRDSIVQIIGLMTAHEQRHGAQIGGVTRHPGFRREGTI